MLALPRLGCLNIHASLLPRWRGAAPIQRAIEAGDDDTGITIMQMDAGLDTGAMLVAETLAIGADDTAGALAGRGWPRSAASSSSQALGALAKGRSSAGPQPEAGVTYAAKIAKDEAAIDWRAPAADDRAPPARVRPFARREQRAGRRDDHLLARRRSPGRRARRGRSSPSTAARSPSPAARADCALTELQRAGGRRMAAEALLRGWTPPVGAVFDPAPDPRRDHEGRLNFAAPSPSSPVTPFDASNLRGLAMFNLLKTAVLMAAITALFMAIGAYVGGRQGMMLALIVALGLNFFSYWFSDKLVLKMYNAREVDETLRAAVLSDDRRAGAEAPGCRCRASTSSTRRRRTRSPPGATPSTPPSPRPPASCRC